ncbi:MAG: protein methyltransferase [Pseudomonadales bacterium]|uniref:class I SAM-dependent methyltransferase n=1 Tax=unclassified Ketobacter TaxID=2639109 RepID=UPI000C92E700|nr:MULTISPECIES: 50S ribosomal protein L11 methyltransferase [unclassified Ketobacter]MAQ26280.1 protein methyltransferase [Pseudomonadales bacterium]MEC8809970.1 50S ribosomal protein L11 methyltransferase [Pseudomonadota bacterium]HAG93130.1 protein methyltransferase [Gammaproteobacteria bacterium]RLT89902.1 MAG: protein methyltransferase [Ketobacter sp. GenoA1]RLT98914.1 MAG: protein methyltransferase [Ketobacter sp.]
MNSHRDLPAILDSVQISPRHLPKVPEIALYLMQDQVPEHHLQQQDYQRLMEAPPYWAFCWGGGQALARWILDNPAVVQGRRVVDFGAGSGVAGVAAALAGAEAVVCVDIDDDALTACRCNGELNGVSLQTSRSLALTNGELLLAADVCYEDTGYSGVINHMAAAGDVVVAESRLRNLAERFPQLRRVGEMRVRTLPDLEESENYDLVHIFRSYQFPKIL